MSVAVVIILIEIIIVASLYVAPQFIKSKRLLYTYGALTFPILFVPMFLSKSMPTLPGFLVALFYGIGIAGVLGVVVKMVVSKLNYRPRIRRLIIASAPLVLLLIGFLSLW